MDDLFDDLDDLLDPTTPEGVVFIAGSGLLGDDPDPGDERCCCWCGCRRRVPWGDDECSRCWEGTHRDDR